MTLLQLNAANARPHCFQLWSIYEGSKAEMHRCQQDEGIAALTGRIVQRQEKEGGIRRRREAPTSDCPVSAGMLTCQLSPLRYPAGTTVGRVHFGCPPTHRLL